MKSRKLLMIPGPIEFEPEVLQAMAVPTTSHVAPNFIDVFKNALKMLKQVCNAPSGQPFVVAGSGTLAMDMAASNLIEKGDRALVIATGYFGERFKDILETYGAKTTILSAPIGEVVSLDIIEETLKAGSYKLLTFTHVDTSTGVMVSPEAICKLAQKYGALTILDGVCSVAGEEILQDKWGVDVVLTGSQKAIGVPPGLALLVASQKAINVWKNRKTPVGNYYASWNNWLPIMTAYQEGRPSYFGTPPVNLILALEKSLGIICKEGVAARVQRHKKLASAFRAAIAALNLSILPKDEVIAAHTLTAIYYPKVIDGARLRAQLLEDDVIVAGGLLAEIKSTYFRVGHMGSVSPNDLLAVLGALERALQLLGFPFESGVGLKTFQNNIV